MPALRGFYLGPKALRGHRRIACGGWLGRRAHQRGQVQNGRPPGARRSRNCDRRLHQHRVVRARGTLWRIARPCELARVQCLHGSDGHHPPQGRHPHVHHFPSHAFRVKPDQARGLGARVLEPLVQGHGHQGREKGGDARAPHQPPQSHLHCG